MAASVPKSTNRPGCTASLWMTCSTVSGRASPNVGIKRLAVMWAMWLAVGGPFVAIAVSIYLGNALRQGAARFHSGGGWLCDPIRGGLSCGREVGNRQKRLESCCRRDTYAGLYWSVFDFR